MNKICRNITEAIGNTPLLELSNITKGYSGRILAKLEYYSPGASKKDRIAKKIIEEAEKNGSLKKGQPVVELTSGNTGSGLAIVCKALGYPFIAVMSEGNSIERAQMMRAFGAEVVLVPQAEGSVANSVSGEDLALVDTETKRIVEERGAFRADQFNNPANSLAHYEETAEEVVDVCGNELDAFCDFAGTGGSFGGAAKRFKEYNENIKCYVVEPDGAAALSGGEVLNPNHPIQGGGYSRPELVLIDKNLADGFIKVSGEEAKKYTKLLASTEGVFAGFSAGANVCAALKLLEGEMKGKTIVILISDSGLKYLSTDLWG